MKKIIGQTAYFSHSKSTYNSELEKTIFNLLKNYFEGNIICPNQDIGHLKDSKEYLAISGQVDCIFVLPSLEDKNYLSAGCFKEVENALFNGVPVYSIFLKNNKLKFRIVYWAERLSLRDSDDYGYIESYKFIF